MSEMQSSFLYAISTQSESISKNHNNKQDTVMMAKEILIMSNLSLL